MFNQKLAPYKTNLIFNNQEITEDLPILGLKRHATPAGVKPELKCLYTPGGTPICDYLYHDKDNKEVDFIEKIRLAKYLLTANSQEVEDYIANLAEKFRYKISHCTLLLFEIFMAKDLIFDRENKYKFILVLENHQNFTNSQEFVNRFKTQIDKNFEKIHHTKNIVVLADDMLANYQYYLNLDGNMRPKPKW